MMNTWNPAEIMDKLNQLEAKVKAEDVEANPTGEATETLTKIGIDGDIYSFTAATSADDVSYDNTTSGLTADDVQEAIDELKTSMPTFTTSTVEVTTGATGTVTLDITTAHPIISIYKIRNVKDSDAAYVSIRTNSDNTVFVAYLTNPDGTAFASKTCDISITHI